jgi:N-acetylmuramoyl-L-alanine amidase
MSINTSYLNATVNKTLRPPGTPRIGRLWHETANGSGNPYTTLEWNLSSNAGSSYDFLIARDGTIFQYVDYDAYTSWHAGDSACTIDGRTYTDWSVNENFIGIELDGPNDGTPCTTAQIDAAALLAILLWEDLGINLTGPYDVTHKQVATPAGRKSDPRGATIGQILTRAHEFASMPAMDEPYVAWWRVITMDGANVREAPTRASPIALNGSAVVPYGNTFQSDTVNYGEPIGGDPVWIHAANKIGFVHRSCLQRTG